MVAADQGGIAGKTDQKNFSMARRTRRELSLRNASLATMLLYLAAVGPCWSQATRSEPVASCGEVVTIATHGSTTTRYALAHPPAASTRNMPIALLLLVGGGGYLDLDDTGCPRALQGNFLVRSLNHFHAVGYITALADARSDHQAMDGLAGFRVAAQHAEDLGRLIVDVRARTKAPVWIVSTSRGTISAANAAARLAGPSAPDGVVLTSTLSFGGNSPRWPWVSQTVFDFRLKTIRIPVLIVGHAADACMRTPATAMGYIAAKTNSSRKQVVTVTGGPGVAAPGVNDCQGRSPHGFLEQEAEVVAGIARFIRGGSY